MPAILTIIGPLSMRRGLALNEFGNNCILLVAKVEDMKGQTFVVLTCVQEVMGPSGLRCRALQIKTLEE